MDILYTRVSSIQQKSERQKVNEKDYDLIIEDKCSGTIPFFERDGGKKILTLINKNEITSISIHQIDRLGRDLKDILSTIEICCSKYICIHFLQQGLRTLDENGKVNPITNMIIGILGVVSEMERSQIKERQYEGIQIAKAKGLYTGRKKGSIEDNLKFLTKHQKSIELLKKGYKAKEVAKINEVSVNTLTKIKKLAGI
jgi:DNA invertase Pin-like site-specific DNA recombinase